MSFPTPPRACRHCNVGSNEERCWNCKRVYTASGVILDAGLVHFGRDTETNYAAQRAASFEQNR